MSTSCDPVLVLITSVSLTQSSVQCSQHTLYMHDTCTLLYSIAPPTVSGGYLPSLGNLCLADCRWLG